MDISLPNAGNAYAGLGDASLYVGVDARQEEAIARFDRALTPFEPDEMLLSGSPARSLSRAMTAVVTALTQIDLERVHRKQNWWHRYTGADLEARIALEISIRAIGGDMRALAEAAGVAERASCAMKRDMVKLDDAQIAHARLIDLTHALLEGSDPTHAVTSRLQRRLGNVEALYASNRLARAQMTLAIDHLDGLLDRYRDIEQLLFPVWQQHALALAQSAVGVGGVEQLTAAHADLTSALNTSKEATT